MTLSGTVLGNLPIKCGPARNPIVQVKTPVAVQPPPIDNDAMAKLKAAQERILSKVGAGSKQAATPTAAAAEQSSSAPPSYDAPRGRSRSPPRRRSRSPRDSRDRTCTAPHVSGFSLAGLGVDVQGFAG